MCVILFFPRCNQPSLSKPHFIRTRFYSNTQTEGWWVFIPIYSGKKKKVKGLEGPKYFFLVGTGKYNFGRKNSPVEPFWLRFFFSAVSLLQGIFFNFLFFLPLYSTWWLLWWRSQNQNQFADVKFFSHAKCWSVSSCIKYHFLGCSQAAFYRNWHSFDLTVPLKAH